MNIIKKLKLDIESLVELVNSEQKFFSPIVSYVKGLNIGIDENEIDIEKLDFLIKKIEEFYKKWRPSTTPCVISIPPRQISNSDSNIKEIQELIAELQSMSSKELEKEINESKNNKFNQNKVNNPLNLNDSQLYDSCKNAFESKDYWDLVFKATRHLEIRIREKANLTSNDIGIDLVSRVFNTNSGSLEIPFCETVAEEEGFFHILRGIFMFHRNVKGHREGQIEPKRALQIVQYIDYLLDVIESAVIRNKKNAP